MYTALHTLPIEFLVETSNVDSTKYRLVVKKKGNIDIVDTLDNYTIVDGIKRMTYLYTFTFGLGTYVFEFYTNYKDVNTYELVDTLAITKVPLDVSVYGLRKIYTTLDAVVCNVADIPTEFQNLVELDNRTSKTIEVGTSREVITTTIAGVISTVVKFNVKVKKGNNRLTARYVDALGNDVITKAGTVVKINNTTWLYGKGKI